MYIGIDFSKDKYDNFVYTEYDNFISDEDLPKIQDIFDKLKHKNAWICDFVANGETFYDTSLFGGNLNFFRNNIKFVKSIEEWNNMEPYSYMNETLEKIFPVLLKSYTHQIYFTGISANKFFDKSEIDIFKAFSNVNIAYNNEDKSSPIIFVIANDGNYQILLDEKLVYQQYYIKNSWLKYPVKLYDQAVNIKIKVNDELLIDRDLSLHNVEELRENCIRYKL